MALDGLGGGGFGGGGGGNLGTGNGDGGLNLGIDNQLQNLLQGVDQQEQLNQLQQKIQAQTAQWNQDQAISAFTNKTLQQAQQFSQQVNKSTNDIADKAVQAAA